MFCREIFLCIDNRNPILYCGYCCKGILIKQQQNPQLLEDFMYISCIMCQVALMICMYIFL